MRVTGSRAGGRRWRPTAGWIATALLALALSACGSATTATLGVTLAEPTATATALPPTATIAPTATATATPRPSVAPTATGTPRPTVAPTVARPTAVAGGYIANWATWDVGEDDQGRFRRGYDRAKDEYHVALTSEDQEWSFYAPEGQRFQNFTLEVEAYEVDGPDSGGYGLVFRRQPKPSDKPASERYIFYVTPQGRFKFFQVAADNTQKVLRQLDAPSQPGVIKVGKEPNRLKVTCQGTTVILAINDIEVFRLTNATIALGGEVGVFATSPTGASLMEVAFRKLQLRPNP